MNSAPTTKRAVAGVFLIALATMMLEILITRIFSVTMWYHFAFVAISLAMFGMTMGALMVYRDPVRYAPANATKEMARSALWFSVTAVVSVLAHILVPLHSELGGAVWIGVTYFLLAFPFYFSGVCICVALTKFPGSVSSLYAADLLGAATGCILLIYALEVTDAPTAAIFVGVLGCLAALLLAADAKAFSLRRRAVTVGVIFATVAILNTALAHEQKSLLEIRWAKGDREARPLFEKWNSYSRIAVSGDATTPSNLITEGISPTFPPSRLHRQLHLRIDSDAETTFTKFDGTFDDLDYFKYDIKNIVHYVRTDASVLIIGAGGGRDVLSALMFGQKSVRAVEINKNILKTVNGRFGDFTGHLDRNPKVTFVNDEARSYIARTDERFDVIEASFIDTWAATAAGAMTLTENSLYTVDAWKLFLTRLNDQGVLSFSRWYLPEMPGEAYRLTSLAAAALRANGVVDPRTHILMVKNSRQHPNGEIIGAATILVSKAPFTAADIQNLQDVAGRMKFDVILTPQFAADPVFASLANGGDPELAGAPLHLNLAAPTDDSPFFFYMTRVRDLFRVRDLANMGLYAASGGIVLGLLVFTMVPTIICVAVPLRTLSRESLRGAWPHFIYFAAIGFGFMLVEISQMQRLIVFLGHPTYALSVVLFALLLSSGLGSYSTRWFDASAVTRLLLLLLAMVCFGLLTTRATQGFASAVTPMRIVIAIGIIFPLGFFMGMAFPLGLKLAARQADDLTPAFWGINGASSICGSVLAVAIAMNAGISSTFWTGFACYIAAFLAYVWARQRNLAATERTPVVLAAAS